MAALVAGDANPKVLARLARRTLRKKITLLEEAFTGHFTDHHAFLLGKMLARVAAISTDIAALDARIEEQIAPLADEVARLDEIPGISLTAAHVILAGIGTDMTRFPTAGHLVSWARLAPGEGVSREEGERLHRPRERLPGGRARERRRGRREDRHLPWRAIPAHPPPPGLQTRHRHGQPLHPCHRLAPAL